MKLPRNSGRLAPELNPFEDEYLQEILQAVARAWSKLKHTKRNEIENQITNRLAGVLQNHRQFHDLPFDIVTQFPQLNIDGKILGQLDLRIKYRSVQREYFAFEAKRLHVTSVGGIFRPEYSEYSGDPGMGAFIEGPYSKDLPAAGMLGYVMDGNTAKAWQGLDKSIAGKRAALALSSGTAIQNSALAAALKGALPKTLLGETFHDLPDRILKMFHLLLPVT